MLSGIDAAEITFTDNADEACILYTLYFTGIDAAEITFTDNADLLKLFEAPQTEGGVLAMLSEECQVPKGIKYKV